MPISYKSRIARILLLSAPEVLPPLSGLPDPAGLHCFYVTAYADCEIFRKLDGVNFKCYFDSISDSALPWLILASRYAVPIAYHGCIIAHVGSLDAAKLFASVYRFPPP